VFLGLSACLTPIDIDVKKANNAVVIAGQVSNLADQSFVQLGLTEMNQIALPVSGAQIWIVDDTTGDLIMLFESATTAGLYKPAHYEGTPGHTYHVQVQFPDRGAYTSDSDIMPPLPGTVTSRYEFKRQPYTDFEGIVSDQPFIFTYVDAQLPDNNEKFYLKWTVDEVYLLSPTDIPDPWGNIPDPCFIEQNAEPQRIALFDGDRIHTRSIENLLISSRVVDWTFLEKHAFTIYQSAMSSSTHRYWEKVDILANQSGSIFDTPPAAVVGNVHAVDSEERTLGYFHATSQVMDRYFIYQSDLPFPLTVADCEYENERSTYPSRCLDCTSVRYSSYRRPEWF
jgi:hypothetical protein